MSLDDETLLLFKNALIDASGVVIYFSIASAILTSVASS